MPFSYPKITKCMLGDPMTTVNQASARISLREELNSQSTKVKRNSIKRSRSRPTKVYSTNLPPLAPSRLVAPSQSCQTAVVPLSVMARLSRQRKRRSQPSTSRRQEALRAKVLLSRLSLSSNTMLEFQQRSAPSLEGLRISPVEIKTHLLLLKFELL